MSTAKSGLYANIHAKQQRIAHGSGEKMRKPGSDGAPSATSFKQSAKTTVAAKKAKRSVAAKKTMAKKTASKKVAEKNTTARKATPKKPAAKKSAQTRKSPSRTA